VTTTKRIRGAGPQDNKAEPSPALGAPELMTRIACKGRAAAPVLEEVRSALAASAARDRDPLIVLEDLGLLQDSVATLIKGLSRLLVGYPRTVTFWESSGYTEAFLSVMEKNV
jgi:hypothetical protein